MVTQQFGRVLLGTLLACVLGCDSRRDSTELDAGWVERIVCGSPAVTEMVFALGCGDRVVGVSDYSSFPPEAAAKPSIGGLMNPNRERLLMLDPDLILTEGDHESLSAFAAQYAVRYHSVRSGRVADILAAIASIAEVLGVPERGEALTSGIENELEAIVQRIESAEAPSVPVLLLLPRTPGDLTGITTIGPGSFLDELLGVAGGRNIFADAKGAAPQVSKESLLVRKPEVILELTGPEPTENTVRRLRDDWQRLEGIPAVDNDRVVYLSDQGVLIPGPRMGWVAGMLARALHPELTW